METQDKKHACVVVLGDWGRSPRMQYHALSLAKNGFTVDVVAYEGAEPHDDVKNNECIRCYYLKNIPKFEQIFPRFMVYILKTLWQSLFLFITLLSISYPHFILLQNPPSIPTLPVCWFVCILRRSNLIIDYHNYGFTILGLAVGKANILVKICKWCETYFGKKAAHSFCVSRAMQEDLSKNWGVRSTVFYDCPPTMFHPVSLEEKHSFFMKLSREYEVFRSSKNSHEDSSVECNRFTEKVDNEIIILSDKLPLIVSSTSWTEDEDFSVLLDALTGYEAAAEDNNLSGVIVAITGKGPLKNMYEELIRKKDFRHVQIITLWLAAEDYPLFLACSDLGICLHKSSSGLDLPMKVVDMFGSGLPVCAISYSCIDELVTHGKNGVLFSSSSELSNQLQELLKGFPDKAKQLQKYRENLSKSPLPRWDESWNKCVLPCLLEQL